MLRTYTLSIGFGKSQHTNTPDILNHPLAPANESAWEPSGLMVFNRGVGVVCLFGIGFDFSKVSSMPYRTCSDSAPT
jgi:hypothetical protein